MGLFHDMMADTDRFLADGEREIRELGKLLESYRSERARDPLYGVPVFGSAEIDEVRCRLLDMADRYQHGPVLRTLLDAVDVIDWLENRLKKEDK